MSTLIARPPCRGVALALASLATGCLPGDTRPVPESVYVTAEPSAGVTLGIETSDGWRITFDRLLLAVGNVGLSEDDASCNAYAEAQYDRLFDFTVAGREKVGTAYGLGTCRIDFRLRGPSFDALLGPGATSSDVAFMRTRGTDRYAEDQNASVLATGAGARGDVTKRFAWLFRRSYKIQNCEALGGGYATTLELTEGGAGELRIEVRGEELFRPLADDGAALWFQPIADADADADGEVTLDELSNAPRPPVDPGGLGGGGGAGGGAATDDPGSLERLIYEDLLPRLLRVAGGGPCEAEERSRR
jgi:hypothetical protein